jgi:cysteinyl-tRNA synthetase
MGLDTFISETREIMSVHLDKTLGYSVTDPQIFRNFAAFWEDEFFADTDALNILRPDIITRVSEYIPEITTYVQQIVDNGYAYETDGSVYFDTVKFDKSKHSYAKLEPWSATNVKLCAEGEGELADSSSVKRNASDFALWKRSKPGEPAWNSPWGNGRPGWHIECSVMASAVLGQNMDIHSGGIDLAFPHHDNELAQAEVF